MPAQGRAVVCLFCGKAWPREDDGPPPEATLREALSHEAECDRNPYRAREERIRQAVRDYHLALDRREHGGTAQDRAIRAVCDVLDMPWTPGAELARREKARKGDPP